MTRTPLTATAALALIPLTLMLGAPLAAQQWQMPRADDAPAQTAPESGDGIDRYALPERSPGSDLDSEIQGLMEGLLDRLQPHLEGLGNELAGTVDEFRPALGELSGLMDDIANYERPERLPNGDILIRRRADAPPPPSTEELQRLLPNTLPAPQDPAPEPMPPRVVPDPDLPQTEL